MNKEQAGQVVEMISRLDIDGLLMISTMPNKNGSYSIKVTCNEGVPAGAQEAIEDVIAQVIGSEKISEDELVIIPDGGYPEAGPLRIPVPHIQTAAAFSFGTMEDMKILRGAVASELRTNGIPPDVKPTLSSIPGGGLGINLSVQDIHSINDRTINAALEVAKQLWNKWGLPEGEFDKRVRVERTKTPTYPYNLPAVSDESDEPISRRAVPIDPDKFKPANDGYAEGVKGRNGAQRSGPG